MDWRGEKRSNATHASTTDPESRLARKGDGKEARLSFAAHALMENRHGLLVDFVVTSATGTAERDAVPRLLDGARERGFRPRTLGADKSYDTADCVAAAKVTFRVADINDVIFNTVGVTIGYILFVAFVRIYRHISHNWEISANPILRYIAERPQITKQAR